MLLTVDEAFRGANFEVIRQELNSFHSQGVWDPTFYVTVLPFVRTGEAVKNLSDYAAPLGLSTTKVYVQ